MSQDPKDQHRIENKRFIKILSEWSSFHLFIADDDEDDIEFFETAYYEINPAFQLTKVNGSDGLIDKLLQSHVLPDLLILDLNMPAKNGFETLQEIRFHKKLSPLPIMVYSTTANVEQVNKTFEMGANMYLQKPHDLDGIKKLVRKILSLDPILYVPQACKEDFLLRVE